MMQQIENFDGILNIVAEIMNLEIKHSHLLSFLTFDVNQDGLICEDDLYQLKKTISIESIVNEDINKIVEYVKSWGTGRSAPDLSQ